MTKKFTLQKIVRYFTTRVMFYDVLKSKIPDNNASLCVGWSGAFPPAENGSAALNYWFLTTLKELKADWAFHTLPWGKRIDKRLFKGVYYSSLQDARLDVVFFNLDVDGLKAARDTHYKKIYHQTYHDYLDSPETIVRQAKDADLLLAPTKWAKDLYFEAGATHVEYLPHGVNTDVFSPQQKTTDSFEALFVSRAMYYKGIVSFLKAIPLVVKEVPYAKFRINAVWDGADAQYPYPYQNGSQIAQEVKALIKKMTEDFPQNLQFTNMWLPYHQARDIYRNADVLVFPSHNEGFGIPMIEAMSCGIPCIVADRYPMKEIVLHKKTGYCLPTKMGEHGMEFPTCQHIAESILNLYNNPKKRRELGAAAREHVLKHYDIHKTMLQLAGMIKKLL